jgi:sugar transferase (PEP-CTERM system associated)
VRSDSASTREETGIASENIAATGSLSAPGYGRFGSELGAVHVVPVSFSRSRTGMVSRFLRQQSSRWFALLAVFEFTLLNLAAVIAVRLRFGASADGLVQALDRMPVNAPLFAIFITLGLGAMGLYQRHRREGSFGTLARMVIGFAAGATGLVVVYYAFPDAYFGRGVLGLSLGVGFLLSLIARAGFHRLISEETLRRRVLVLGSGRRAETITRRMRRRIDQRGAQVLGFVQMPGDEASEVPRDRVLKFDMPLVEYAREHRIDEIVVGPDDRRGGLPMGELLACRLAGIDVIDLPGFFERETGKVKLDLVAPSWLVFSDGFKSSVMRLFLKRCSDMLAAGLILAIFWPVMILTALAIWIESGFRGPVLYRQQRVGEGGQPFQLIKFRSMRTDAEKDGIARWAKQNDDRITRVGRIIRATRLDELPQLWNVLSGEMSLVGPRPERPQFVEQLAQRIPYYGLRHCVKPGLAGWAQLRYPYGASEEDAVEKLKFDLYYAKNHDVLFDLKVLIQTVEVVIFRRGAR